MRVGASQILAYTRAVAVVGPQIEDLYWAGRHTLINDHRDHSLYDTLFESVFLGSDGEVPPSQIVMSSSDGAEPDSELTTTNPREQQILILDGEDDSTRNVSQPSASDLEVLRERHFDEWTEEELADLSRLLPRLKAPKHQSRRTRPANRGETIDLRRSIRSSLRYQGDLVDLRWRRRTKRRRRVVLIVDVSGSMAGYSRALIQFAYGARRASQRVEVFCFGTRLTRLTGALATRDPDTALSEATELVVDWDGGTRIGESLNTYAKQWGKQSFTRGAIVIICSDGLERGETSQISAALERISRQSHAIIWVNPLKGDPNFQPLARGLIAAMPYIDAMVAGHNLIGLNGLAQVLDDLG